MNAEQPVLCPSSVCDHSTFSAFLRYFPDGYNTHVGERGATLSGGQKQRVAIARALLLNPRILILDDSTSSFDLNTEAQLQNALEILMKGRTSFVIAHRLSTVQNATRIAVLEQGHLIELGTHAELLAKDELYARLYRLQFQNNQPMPI